MELIIVRHALPVRIEGAEGAADPALSEHGHRQAAETAEFLSAEEIDHIVSSPMQRAMETAAPLARKLGVEVEVVEGLAEMDRHSDTYIPMEDMKAEGGEYWESLVADPLAIFGDSNPEEFRDTVMAAMDAVITANRGRTVAAFCHGGVSGTYVNTVLGITDPFALGPEYCGISRVTAASNGLRTVRSCNETAHVRHLLPPRL